MNLNCKYQYELINYFTLKKSSSIIHLSTYHLSMHVYNFLAPFTAKLEIININILNIFPDCDFEILFSFNKNQGFWFLLEMANSRSGKKIFSMNLEHLVITKKLSKARVCYKDSKTNPKSSPLPKNETT